MPKNLNDLIDDRFGVKTTSRLNPLVTQVETTPTRILSNNPRRVAALIVNLGVNNIFILPDEDVTIANGIILSANGGNITIIWDEDFHITGWNWFGVGSVATAILVVEIEIYD